MNELTVVEHITDDTRTLVTRRGQLGLETVTRTKVTHDVLSATGETQQSFRHLNTAINYVESRWRRYHRVMEIRAALAEYRVSHPRASERELTEHLAQGVKRAAQKLHKVAKDSGSEAPGHASRRAFDDLHCYVTQLAGILELREDGRV